MARIAGVSLPQNKRLEVALTYIYGVGPTTAKKVLADTGISPDVRVKDLPEAQANQLRDVIEKQHKVAFELSTERSGVGSQDWGMFCSVKPIWFVYGK
jgi:small subunit ribosomal protein S13